MQHDRSRPRGPGFGDAEVVRKARALTELAYATLTVPPITGCEHVQPGDAWACNAHLLEQGIRCTACVTAHRRHDPVVTICATCSFDTVAIAERYWVLRLSAPLLVLKPDGSWARIDGQIGVVGVSICRECSDVLDRDFAEP